MPIKIVNQKAWFTRIFSVDSGYIYSLLSLTVSYLIAPILIYLYFDPREEYMSMALYTIIILVFITVGYNFNGFDHQISSSKGKIAIQNGGISKWIFFSFIVFVGITLITAPSIPILSAAIGSDINTLSVERGQFLKGREGGWKVLAYLSTLFTGFLVPYSLIDSFSGRRRFRYPLLIIALVYSVSFLVKGLFLNFVLPFFVWWSDQQLISQRKIIGVFVVSAVCIFGLIEISGYGSLDGMEGYDVTDFFSTVYVPSSTIDFFLYRSISIPIFSVADTLYIHSTDLGGKLLFGSTSTLIANLLGQDRVDIEKIVFAYQYGGWNEFGSSNVVYICDAFINFGYVGLVLYGLIIGYMLRIFRVSTDPALRSLSVLFACLMYSSPLIGILLSNGYILVFFFSFAVKSDVVVSTK